MYSQYLTQGPFEPVGEEGVWEEGGEAHAPPPSKHPQQHKDSRPAPVPQEPPRRPEGPSSRPPRADLLGEVTGGLRSLLEGPLKHFSLSKLDSGDILLALIILFLYLEGDNLELVIILGLMLLFGLGED